MLSDNTIESINEEQSHQQNKETTEQPQIDNKPCPTKPKSIIF
jgi:hypothetical protein